MQKRASSVGPSLAIFRSTAERPSSIAMSMALLRVMGTYQQQISV
jgi:hypothetical protein